MFGRWILSVIFLICGSALAAPADDYLKSVFEDANRKVQQATKKEDCPEPIDFANIFGNKPVKKTSEQSAPSTTASGDGLIPPPREKNSIHGYPPMTCPITANTHSELCHFLDTKQTFRFQFRNEGPNAIVSGDDTDSKYRLWQFNFPNSATQDLSFQATDSPGTEAHIQTNYMMVFPRKTLPMLEETEDGKQIVTLPTGEKVIFNLKTHEIIGGVLSEGKMKSPKREVDPVNVQYNGSGVLVRVDKRSDEPRRGTMATITKQGQSCKVPASKLWPDQRESSSFHFKYSNDKEFDNFLRQTCGFGIY